MSGITFDTGALLALVDQKHLSMQKVFAAAQKDEVPIHVPAVAVAEWWRTGQREKERLACLRAMHVVNTDARLAKMAGSALTVVKSATTIDAIVMMTAAYCGDLVVYTSDPDDLERLRDRVPALRNIRIQRA